MEWIFENWVLIVAVICVGVAVAVKLRNFAELPNDEKETMVKEWLLWAVTVAEKELGNGTGALKLRFVYDKFALTFPWMVVYVSFDVFAQWVDEALVNMKQLLVSNAAAEKLVKGENDG